MKCPRAMPLNHCPACDEGALNNPNTSNSSACVDSHRMTSHDEIWEQVTVFPFLPPHPQSDSVGKSRFCRLPPDPACDIRMSCDISGNDAVSQAVFFSFVFG